MATKEFIKEVLDYINEKRPIIQYNSAIFDILEGDLMKHLEISLRKQLSPQSANIAMERAAPINIWGKIVRKLSKLYAKSPIRTTLNPADQELIEYYEIKGINRHFGNLNENYNAYKWSSLEIFEDTELGELRFRAVPSDKFLAFSDDRVDPMRITAIIKFMGLVKDNYNNSREKFWIYTENEFIPVLDSGEIVTQDLVDNEGINPFGVIPFQYASMSEYLLVPYPDRDTLQMSTLIPVLLTDQNFGSLFLSLPILYAVDADLENMPVSPNMFINLKSDDEGKQAQIGVVKAEPNLEAQMNHVKNQLAMWLESRDIKPGSIGGLTGNPENFASGISKIISEMDTLENRKMQEEIFRDVENRFWRRLAIMHNALASVGRIENRQMFSNPYELNVNIQYAEDQIIESRVDKVSRLKIEVDAGFISIKRAIKELNPNMEDEHIDDLIEDIEEDKPTTIIQEVMNGPDESNYTDTEEV